MLTPSYPGADVNALQKEKATSLIALGKIMHKLIRDGSITDEACVRYSGRISQIDAELCVAEGRRIPRQGEGVCPICGALLASPVASFCGACGANVTEFYTQNTTTCERCGQITAADGQYCTVCGVRRVT